ncbi:32900_t:CDS:2 [Racocetra persica]|uniref:32900_t:CDS:1 n=1 Tax=Racocetra persica TaxID=160502 RepID=A0ACA9P3X9_9GLOM|nr:32900_t:CDS:2 [Racocetra persica]
MEDSKIQEALRYLEQGDKATEKNWFKKPEWDVAGQNYEKAASCFKAARSYDQAIQAYQKASDALFKSDSLFMAAKTTESAATIAALHLKQPERAAEMYKKASDLYLANMSPDRAGEMLEKGARALEPVNVDSAIELYMAACSLFESEDRGRFAIDTFRKAVAVMIKHKRYEAAVDILHRLNAIYQSISNQQGLNKTCLSIIITLLAAEDEVEAKKQFQLFCLHAFVQSEESAIASALLDAFEQGDQDLLTQTVRKQTVIFLDNEIAKLARGLQVPGAISQLPTAQSNTSNNEDNYIIPYHVDEQRPLPPEPTEASTSTFAPNQTEIEDEDDIC